MWAITVHKSQELTLLKAVIDLEKKKYAASLSFVAISRINALKNILFKPFSFERLQRIKTCKRLQKRKEEEKWLDSMIFQNWYLYYNIEIFCINCIIKLNSLWENFFIEHHGNKYKSKICNVTQWILTVHTFLWYIF